MTSKNIEKISYNALNLATNCSGNLLLKMKSFYGSFEKAWSASHYDEFLANYPQFSLETIQNLYQNKRQIDPVKEWEKLNNLGIKMFFIDEEEYPQLLKETANPPLGLYQLGNYNRAQPVIAIVGTRKPTSYGKMTAEKITKELVERGFIIVSGLAYGIDTICHQTTLENGGQTIGVLGSGLDIIFPAINKKIAQKIINNGSLVSEYTLMTPPLKYHFPARNRIISGLSLGVVVVEAPLKSGALITARFALEQNREVFAVPGSIFSSNSEGTHHLIKTGAKLIHSIDDILEELNIMTETKINTSRENLIKESLSIEENKILDMIKQADRPLWVDEIISLSQLNANVVNKILTLLELKNLIKLDNNGYRIKI